MSEILAPAGGKNSALAAINAGTNAIYLGLDKFSARSAAENFTDENFEDICKYAHAFGVKVYAALNTVVKDGELKPFLDSVITAWNGGADALILQDIFLGRYIKNLFPDIRLHLSTQAGCCNLYGAELAKEYGFERVILARETKLSDIKKISEIIETETFVQGALCTCFSGQCYMSSFAGGNSGNRGKCKQPCRKLYSIDRHGFEEEAYRLSLSDLCVGENIEILKEAGVSSFKIEGRMRRPEYVSAAVKYYRNLLDNNPADLSELKRTYNRGNYTKGLSFGQDKSFISSSVQGHIGEFVGIVKVENSKYICKSKNKFCKGDGFKILRSGKEVGGGAFGGETENGFIINTRDRLKNGDKVFITTDAKLNESLLSASKSITVRIKADFSVGKPPIAIINGLTIMGECPLEQAKSKPLSAADIERCFKKVDGYPFEPECEIYTDGVFVAASALNAFRRRIYAKYYEFISKTGNTVYNNEFPLPEIVGGVNPKTAVMSTNLSGVKADIGILKPNDYSCDLQKLIGGFEGEKFLYIPPYVTGEDLETLTEISRLFDGIYCDSFFGIKLAEKINKPLFAGTGFNIANRVSLSQLNAKYVCLSKEITVREANSLSVTNTFYLSSGNIKVMDLIYCPFEKKCASCDKRNEYSLTDSDGRSFPLRRYSISECRFEVYNCADLITEGVKCGKLTDRTLSKQSKNYTRGHSVNGIF